MINKMVTGGYTRKDVLTTLSNVTLVVNTTIENATAGIKMHTVVSVLNKNEQEVLTQSFEKLIPLEDFKYLDVPYAVSEDGIIFNYNNHTIKYSAESTNLLVIEERDTRVDIITSRLSFNTDTGSGLAIRGSVNAADL